MSDELSRDFAACARAAFNFLESFGFRYSGESEYSVRYESPRVFVEVSLGERDGEVAVDFGRTAMNERISFGMFLPSVNRVLDATLAHCIAENREQRDDLLVRQAAALRLEGTDILRGVDAVFERARLLTSRDYPASPLQ